MDEPDVVRRVHKFVAGWRLDEEPATRVFTDPHPTLIGFTTLRPFQRFRIEVAGQIVHPDLLCHQSKGNSLFAVEAKGDDDLLKGLFQAESYLVAVQRSFLAAPANRLTESLVDAARVKGVGVLAVSDVVDAVWVPAARRPFNQPYSALIDDIEGAAWVTDAGTYTYNVPTHYLVWTLVLSSARHADLTQTEALLRGYPLPQDWRATLRGAAKLGLVVVDGRDAYLTDVGRAVRALMPPTFGAWAEVHALLTDRGARLTLNQVHPTSAAALRLLLLQDPIVRLVMQGLRSLGAAGGSFDRLAAACSALDPRRSSIFFLKPEAAAKWVRDNGTVDWPSVPGSDFRSTTFFQYKSILKHAGLVTAGALGGASSRYYAPGKDFWQTADA